ncbi:MULTISPECIES: hypothetical protein [Sphingobacterium]|nr:MULTISPECIES: hypothetical protein [Sphingobacterium]
MPAYSADNSKMLYAFESIKWGGIEHEIRDQVLPALTKPDFSML